MDKDIMEIVFGAEGVEIEREKFHVTSLQSASWCMAKASTAITKIANAQAMKNEAIGRIDAWFEEYTTEHNATIDSMKYFLEPWVVEQTQDQKSKSVKLPNGTAGFRTTPESIVIKDDKAMVDEAKKLDIPVQTKEYVTKTDIKKYIKDTGVVLENAFITPGSEKFYVKIKEE